LFSGFPEIDPEPLRLAFVASGKVKNFDTLNVPISGLYLLASAAAGRLHLLSETTRS
jgi:hypothetical protein